MSDWVTYWGNPPRVIYFLVQTLNGEGLDWWGPFESEAEAKNYRLYHPRDTHVVGFARAVDGGQHEPSR